MSPEIAFVVGAIALYSIYQLVKAAKQELANERLRVEGELSKWPAPTRCEVVPENRTGV